MIISYSKEDLIDWFDEKLNNCYHLEEDNGNVVWFYDKNYIRMKKIADIEGKEIDIPKFDAKKVMFYQDNENKFFDCDYDKI